MGGGGHCFPLCSWSECKHAELTYFCVFVCPREIATLNTDSMETSPHLPLRQWTCRGVVSRAILPIPHLHKHTSPCTLTHTDSGRSQTPRCPVACVPGPAPLCSRANNSRPKGKIRPVSLRGRPTCPGGSAEKGQQPQRPGPHGPEDAGRGRTCKGRCQQSACSSLVDDSICRDARGGGGLRVSPPFFSLILFYIFGCHLVDLL